MKILVIGNGGREHALAWKLAQSAKISTVYVAPGNAGTALEHKVENIPLTTIHELIAFAKANDVYFTLVGPEAPLAAGIVDAFRAQQLRIFGPTRFCAQLESSKIFAKNFMYKYAIPTAKYAVFDNADTALDYLQQQGVPIVIKADGLAAGKGVLVATSLQPALDFIDDIFAHKKFGDAGNRVVIEECLRGTEVSFITMIDGTNILPMASSQDHKRLLDHDLGPNTGGMGAISPSPIMTDKLQQIVIDTIIRPVITGMQQEGYSYTGFLYAGLMVDTAGNPKTLEFNCRFGDPETQPIMLRLDSDLFELIDHGINGTLDQITAAWNPQAATGIVIASKGYPDAPQTGDIILGLDGAADNTVCVDTVAHTNRTAHLTDTKIFHAATTMNSLGQIVTNGGRVLCVTALGKNRAAASKNAFSALKQISFPGMQYRTDI